MLRVLPLLIFLLSIQLGYSQSNFWQDIDEQSINLAPNSQRQITPTKYRTLHLEKAAVENYLINAPHSNCLDVENPIQLEMPLPDGTNEIFDVVYDPVMPPVLAAKFPTAKSYMARSIDGTKNMRFGVNSKGLYAIIRTRAGVAFIYPYAVNNINHHISYYAKDDPNDVTFSCGAHSNMFPESATATMTMDLADKPPVRMRGASGIVERREYRAAVACVAEWTANQGGTVASAMEEIVEATDILNSYFETEHAIKFTLVENNDVLVHTDPTTDPYSNVTLGGGLLQQNVNALNEALGFTNYDIGHVFTNACSDVGGVAGGTVCSNGKGAGVTCFYTMNTPFIVSNVMAHEIAHQFSAAHTWSNCPGILDQLASSNAYEPGSGTTIMSYSGSCGDQNISPVGNGDYYHVASLDQVYTFSHEAGGNECGEDIVNTNNYPEITDWLYTDGFYIPKSTPFELTGSATDIDGDVITYCWEQFNLGPLSELGAPTNNSPIFRSYAPNVNPMRVFPRLGKIINNNYDNTEVLPTYGRDLNFRLTARDNRVDGGGATWQEVAFHVADNAGPFVITTPNLDSTSFEAGQYVEAFWTVANTDIAPVNCEFVNILLSTDGGFTYPFTLAENTPNDGAHFITLPNVTTSTARVRIEAVGNIFFDISNQNFDITPPTDTTFAASVGPSYQQLCLPTSTDFTFNTFGLNGYNNPVTVAIVSGLPADAITTFTNNGSAPGTDIELNLDLTNVVSAGSFDLEFMLTATDADTAYRTVTIETISNDFSSLALTTPAAGASGIAGTPTFEWVDVPDAQFYDIQIATSPAFGPNDIVDEKYGFTNSFHDVSVLLEINTIHYWRVRPSNICGEGEWTAIGAFHTESLSCNNTPSDNVPINIPFQGTPVIESTITVLTDGIINDLNVATFIGNHDLVKHLDVSLTSPAGTEVLLFSDLCGNTTTWNFGLDDEAPLDIPCPPITQQVHKPQNPLSAFNGESTMGTWTLKLDVVDPDGNGGTLSDWSLDFCSNVALSPPFLVTNDPLVTPLNATSSIAKNLLFVDDDNNTANDLLYTIVDVPLYGTLMYDNDPVVPGTQLTQGAINDFRLQYTQDGSNVTEDNFTFNVSDQEGGWIGILTFDIEIDPNASVNTTDLENNNNITLFPNPTTNDFSILFDQVIDGKLNVEVINIQGQVILSNTFAQGQEVIKIAGKELPAGIYVVRVTADGGTFSDKITVYK